jgi:hypothetical protein
MQSKWLGLVWLLCVALNVSAQTKPSQTVQTFFTLLKGQQYAKLQELLPSQMQAQISREQLTANLKRLEGFLVLERMQVGRVQEKGDYAVVDTVIYGKLKQPMNFNGTSINEGRVTTQQYLFKENGQWKVVTADEGARAFFLKRNPQFNQQFQLSKPQFAFKRDGQWQSLQSRKRM